MKYRLLASDIDGTLLTDHKEISPKTIETIKRLSQKGVIFVLSTGRSPLGVKKITQNFDFEIPCICYNGALVMTTKDKTILFEKTILMTDALKVIDILMQLNYSFVVWKDNNIFSNTLNEEVITYANKYQKTPQIVDDFINVSSMGIHKILVTSTPQKINKLQTRLKQILFTNLDYYPSSPNYLEIVNNQTSKGIALKYVSDKYNIPQNEIVVIGDSFNDLSMFEYSGLKIAMENAPKEIKSKADTITDTNNNDGVRKAIEKYILKE